MQRNNSLSIELFKVLAAGLSLAIALPALANKSYHIFMLTTFVFLFGKLIDSVESFFATNQKSMHILYASGCLLGVLSLMFCMYYLGIIIDDVNDNSSANIIITTISNMPKNDTNVAIDTGKTLGSNIPKFFLLLKNNILWLFPFLASAFYVLVDIYHLVCVLYKHYLTKIHVLKYQENL